MQQKQGGLAPFSQKGGPAPFFLSIGTPRTRADALLEHALTALKEGRHADALVAAEYVCRAYPMNKIPAILRAHIVQALQPGLTTDAWLHAWRRAPEDPALQGQLLKVLLDAGQVEKIAELGPAFLPGRCRNERHANLVATLRQAGLGWLGACWKNGEHIELVAFAPPGATPQATLLLSDETQQWQYQIPADGRRCRLPCPKPDGVWSLAIVPADGSDTQLLPGSPLAFYPAPLTRVASAASAPAPRQRAHAAAPAVAVEAPRPVSIVIPVYRDFELVQRCINSVLASLPLNKLQSQIVVVDDASPEPELSTWLDGLAQQGKITLLRNHFNLGFIETVNRGMRAQPNCDVLMLNADTSVHGNWIDRLSAALYQAPGIASVTPWTNNGEMSSFPKIAKAAPAPDDEQLALIDRTASLLRAAGQTSDVELPSCCGFAMLMRRSVLDQIGMLDGSALERGYGEETDWCLRARAAGYRHLHATAVFVAHSGTVSFKLEKSLRVKQNNKVVHERYPKFREEYAQFLLHDPLLSARRTLQAALPALPGNGNETLIEQQVSQGSILQASADQPRRVLVWQHRQNSPGSAALMALARRIATDSLAIRLLVIGEVSESMWRTGVIEGMPSGLESDYLLLDDYDLAALAGCCTVLTETPCNAPTDLSLYILDEHFDADQWLTGIMQTKTLQ